MTSLLDPIRTEEPTPVALPLPSAARELCRRIQSREAVVAIIGLGYVGLPLAVGYAQAGFRVVGIDLDTRRVDTLQSGVSPVEDVPSSVLEPLMAPVSSLFAQRGTEDVRGSLSVTSDYDIISAVDAIIICVPTPLSQTKDPDMSYVMAATEQISRRLRPGVLVVLESTTFPGTTEELVLPLLENPLAFHSRRSSDQRRISRSPLVVGRDFFLAFSPERIDPGRKDFTVRTTPKVIGGVTDTCRHASTALYSTCIDTVVPVSSPQVAEMVKLLENTFRSVNIALVNELAMWCDRLNVDVWEVIGAASTKPFGYMPFWPGPGLGGHCIPIDPQYLAWKLRTLDYHAQFIHVAAEINVSMPKHVVSKVVDALNDDFKSVRGARILVLGVAYKRNVSDVRESPAIEVIRLLRGRGAAVSFADPYVSQLKVDDCVMHPQPADYEAYDAVVIVTDHDEFDWNDVVTRSRTVVDTRNATSRAVVSPTARIVKL